MTVSALRVELQAAGDQLVGNDDVLRSVLAGSGDCIKILDLEGRLQFMSEGGKQVMEVDDFSRLKGCPWPDFWVGDGHAHAADAVESARAGRTARFTGAADTAKGSPRYWDVRVSPIFGANGKPAHLLSISRDITEEHEAAIALQDAVARQEVLTGELQHRIKNTLAVVSAIAQQTLRGDDVAAAREALTSRLVSLGQAHDILTDTSWVGAPIGEVISRALAFHDIATRFKLDGPDLVLSPKPALSLAMALHELATNALKYGALSNEDGVVTVIWSVDDGMFLFRWTEIGGPPIAQPPTRKGFGTRLIDSVLAHDFNGSVSLRYEPGGLISELRAPIDELTAT